MSVQEGARPSHARTWRQLIPPLRRGISRLLYFRCVVPQPLRQYTRGCWIQMDPDAGVRPVAAGGVIHVHRQQHSASAAGWTRTAEPGLVLLLVVVGVKV